MFEFLELAIAENDPIAVQDAIFDLGLFYTDERLIPDEVSFKVIDLLGQEAMSRSSLAAHLLNHFEFHASCISQRAKDACVRFLQAQGDRFLHVHSQQVVSELRHGSYLR